MSENVRELTPKQHQAFDLLMAGASLSDISEQLDIDLRTLYRWRHLPAFVALQRELQLRRQEEIRERFTEIMRLAFVSLERGLKNAEDPERMNPISTALEVLKLMHSVPMLAPPVMSPQPPALIPPEVMSPNSANS